MTDLLEQGDTPEKLLERILRNMGLEITDTMPAEFYCNCSRGGLRKL